MFSDSGRSASSTDSEDSQESRVPALAALWTRRNLGTFDCQKVLCPWNPGTLVCQKVLCPLSGDLIGWDIDICGNFYGKFEMRKLYKITLDYVRNLGNFTTIRHHRDLSAAHKIFRSFLKNENAEAIWCPLPHDCCTAPPYVACSYEGKGIPMHELAHAVVGPEYGKWPGWSVWMFDWFDILRVFKDEDLVKIFNDGWRFLVGCVYAAPTSSYDPSIPHNRYYIGGVAGAARSFEEDCLYTMQRKTLQEEGIPFAYKYFKHQRRRWRFHLLFSDGNVLEFYPDWKTGTAQVAWVTVEHCTELAWMARFPMTGSPSQMLLQIITEIEERMTCIEFRGDREFREAADNQGPLHGLVMPWHGSTSEGGFIREVMKKKNEQSDRAISSLQQRFNAVWRLTRRSVLLTRGPDRRNVTTVHRRKHLRRALGWKRHHLRRKHVRQKNQLLQKQLHLTLILLMRSMRQTW